MEKLKCSSCGGEITVDDDKEYGTCPYCGTKYKLNQDVNVNIKLDDNMKEVLNNGLETTKHFSKFIFIPIIMFFVIFAFVIFSFFSFGSKRDINSFNFKFTNDSGTKSAFFMGDILDDVIESNKTHDRKVVLVFDGKEITDESEIVSIKHSLSGSYEVSLNYDDKGYINKMIVNKIEKSDNNISDKIKDIQENIESDDLMNQIDEMQDYMNSDEYQKQIQEAQERAKSLFGN